jgi:hypothetical protein
LGVSPLFYLKTKEDQSFETVIFEVLRFLRLLEKQAMDKVQNKESSNIIPSPKTFREEQKEDTQQEDQDQNVNKWLAKMLHKRKQEHG